MVYNLTIETRRRYREAEVAKHGLEELNRLQALRRALKKGKVSDLLMERYQFTAEDLPFLAREPSSGNDKHLIQSDKASSVLSEKEHF